jgi:hypothetical protein
MTGVRVRDLHEKWVQDPEYRAAYNGMENEFVLAAELIKLRSRRYLPSSEPALIHMTQEKERVLERLARLNAERVKLSDQLNELAIAERVLTRFGGRRDTAGRERRRRPARTAPAAGGQRRARGGPQAPSVSLSDATLRAVQAYPDGATASEILRYLAWEFGMAVRPNHLGITLQRHRRAGRLESRESRWFLPQQAATSQLAMTA